METKFIELAKKRRSIYALGKNVSFSQDELVDLIESNIKQGPSSFNNQTTRAIILFDASHDKLWDIVADSLHKVAKDDDAFAKTQAKINGFKAAYGTILYFTETKTVRDFEQNFPLYADTSKIGPNSLKGMHSMPCGRHSPKTAWVRTSNTTIH